MSEQVYVNLEFTPNPNSLKFLVNRALLPKGAQNFDSKEETSHSPLARAVFDVPGICGVLIGTNFVTISKSPEGDWDTIAEAVPKAIESILNSDQSPFDPKWLNQKFSTEKKGESEVEKKILDLLDKEIRPAVAMDGGDILFDRFEDGILYLHLQGACSTCPSATMTLKMGVESRLKSAIPEIKEVVQV